MSPIRRDAASLSERTGVVKEEPPQPVAAKPPADMALGNPFGPGIVSAVTYFHASQMISYSRLTEMLQAPANNLSVLFRRRGVTADP